MVSKEVIGSPSSNPPFPNILVCSQSMHSKMKVKKLYPDMSDADIAFLYGFGIPKAKKMSWGIGPNMSK